MKYVTVSVCIRCQCAYEHSKYQRNRKHCSPCSREVKRERLVERNKISHKVRWQRTLGDGWKERYDEWLAKMSAVTSGERNPMYGRHDHVHGLQRVARENTGRTLEEIHGVEKAADIRVRTSKALSGENNPAYGRAYVNGGKSVKGYYKGLFFRSLLEYSFMKHLESTGLCLHSDVDYEHVVIPFEFEGRKRTYRPDFSVKTTQIVYEVKPRYVIDSHNSLQLAKWSAAREFFSHLGVEFIVVSELDFCKVSFEEALQDPNVSWKTETFKYFKETT